MAQQQQTADILDRLRLIAAWKKPGGAYPDRPMPDPYPALCEAVAEIERLRAVAEYAAHDFDQDEIPEGADHA